MRNSQSGTWLRLAVLGTTAIGLSACGSLIGKGDPAPLPPPPPPSVPSSDGEYTPPPSTGGVTQTTPDYSTATVQVVPGSVQDFEQTSATIVYFDFNSHSIRNDGAQDLAQQAQWLRQYPNVKVRIAGNCDERGTREYNLALGARRANAAKSFLIAQGIDASRISTVSYGKERPMNPASNEAAWAENRNAQTDIIEGARQ